MFNIISVFIKIDNKFTLHLHIMNGMLIPS